MPFDPDREISSVIEEIIQRLVGPGKQSIAQDYGLFVRRRNHKGVWLKPSRTLSDYPQLFVRRKVLSLRYPPFVDSTSKTFFIGPKCRTYAPGSISHHCAA